jgi:hypothetical protein
MIGKTASQTDEAFDHSLSKDACHLLHLRVGEGFEEVAIESQFGEAGIFQQPGQRLAIENHGMPKLSVNCTELIRRFNHAAFDGKQTVKGKRVWCADKYPASWPQQGYDGVQKFKRLHGFMDEARNDGHVITLRRQNFQCFETILDESFNDGKPGVVAKDIPGAADEFIGRLDDGPSAEIEGYYNRHARQKNGAAANFEYAAGPLSQQEHGVSLLTGGRADMLEAIVLEIGPGVGIGRQQLAEWQFAHLSVPAAFVVILSTLGHRLTSSRVDTSNAGEVKAIRAQHRPAMLSETDIISGLQALCPRGYFLSTTRAGRVTLSGLTVRIEPLHASAIAIISVIGKADAPYEDFGRELSDDVRGGRSPVGTVIKLLNLAMARRDVGLLQHLLENLIDCWALDHSMGKAFLAALSTVSAAATERETIETLKGWVERIAVESLLPDCEPYFSSAALAGLAFPAIKINSTRTMLCLCRRWGKTNTKGLPFIADMLGALWEEGLGREIADLIVASVDRPVTYPQAVRLRYQLALERGEDLSPLQQLAERMDPKARDFEKTRCWIRDLPGTSHCGAGTPIDDDNVLVRLTASDCGELSEMLSPLLPIANAPFRHGEMPDVAAIRTASTTIGAQLERREGNFSAQERIRVAANLYSIAEVSFRTLAFFAETTPFARTAKYGTLDPARYKAVHSLFMEIVSALVLGVLRKTTEAGPLDRHGRRHAVILLAASAIRLGTCSQVGRVVEQVVTEAMLEASPSEWLCLEKCYLALDDIANAARVREAGNIGAGTIHHLLTFSDWAKSEGLAARLLFADGAEAGSFQYIGSDGALRVHSHEVPASEIQAAQASGLRMLGPHLILGENSHLLRPRDYVQDGEFPYAGPHILNRVSGKSVAVTLKAAEEWKVIEEPVAVLDHTVTQSNYYHWMLEYVSRVVWADQQGLIGSRKLLVADGLTAWMLEALELAGVGSKRLCFVTGSDALYLEDGLVLSSVDFSSRSLFDAMRRRFWAAAGLAVPEKSRNGRLLFLSRPAERFRGLRNQDEIESVASDMGFEIIHAERYSISEQVRLLASASGIAGLEGAAFTNQIFAPDGIRVLAISKEDDNEPTYINLSILAGQERRVIGGITAARHLAFKPLMSPYWVEPELVRAGLSWVKGG